MRLGDSMKRRSSARIPHEPEVERAVVSGLIDPRNSLLLPLARRLINVSDFYELANAKIFEAICAVADSGQSIDKVSIVERLRRSGDLRAVGGPESISVDFDIVVDAPRIREWAASLREASRKRELYRTGKQILNAALNGATADEVLLQVHSRIGQLENRSREGAEPIDGAALFNALADFIKRYVVISPAQLTAVCLFVLHTHAFEAAYFTPYLLIKSPDKRCGKTRMLDVLELLVRKPWRTDRTSAAALIRKVDASQPTLLLDELDAAFAGDREYSETLRSVLNSGFQRGKTVSLVTGKGADMTVRDFNVFCPKALAAIGRLPSTVEDRGITIAMRRIARTEKADRFYAREVREKAEELRYMAAAWADANITRLRESRPELPTKIRDRAADCWEPLLAIADIVGGRWSQDARNSAIELSTGEDISLGVKLLSDIRDIFDSLNADKIPTKTLIQELVIREDSPWAEYSNNKPLSPSRLARLLREFGPRPRQIWIGENVQGYERGQFEDPWMRYLEDTTERPGAPRTEVESAIDATPETLEFGGSKDV